LVARTEPHHEFKVGETVNFTPRLEKARYFDKETELSVLAELDTAALK
jgi:multiple sugar transport system ATP-binding protein